jgi:hypothetical protein
MRLYIVSSTAWIIYKLYHDELNPQLLKDIVYIKVKELDPEILACVN